MDTHDHHARYEVRHFVLYDEYGRAVNRFLPVDCSPRGPHHELAVAWCATSRDPRAASAGEEERTMAVCVPFEHVASLVRARSSGLLLERGNACVSREFWEGVFASHYRSRLTQELVVARRVVPTLLEVEAGRLGLVLLALAERMDAAAAAASTHRWMPSVGGVGLPPLALSELDARAVLFPPCMFAIMRELRR